MERENQRITITKRLLKEAMLSLLREKEADKINVTELCRRAGINRATFYRHYGIPRDVLVEMERDFFLQCRSGVPIPKTIGEVRHSVTRMCEYLEENAELMRILILSNSDADFVLFFEDICQAVLECIRSLDILPPLKQDEVTVLSLYSAGGCYFLLRHWVLGNIPMSARQMADCMCALLEKTEQLTRGGSC